MAKSKYEGDQKYNKQSDFSSSRDREGLACDSIHGCLQGNIKSDGSIDKLKFIIVVRGDI